MNWKFRNYGKGENSDEPDRLHGNPSEPPVFECDRSSWQVVSTGIDASNFGLSDSAVPGLGAAELSNSSFSFGGVGLDANSTTPVLNRNYRS